MIRLPIASSDRAKCPINAERVADGRGFEFPTGNVAMRLSSVHALSSTLYIYFGSKARVISS